MDKTYSKISYCPTCNGSNDEHAVKCSWCGNQFVKESGDIGYMEGITRWIESPGLSYRKPKSHAEFAPLSYNEAVFDVKMDRQFEVVSTAMQILRFIRSLFKP